MEVRALLRSLLRTGAILIVFLWIGTSLLTAQVFPPTLYVNDIYPPPPEDGFVVFSREGLYGSDPLWGPAMLDLNGDGFDDLVLTTFWRDVGSRGVVAVVYGRSEMDSVNVSSLNGSNGFVFEGVRDGDHAGQNAVAVGDFNGDGRQDLALAAPFADPDGRQNAGEVYVVFGSDEFPETFRLKRLDGTNGITIGGSAPREQIGDDNSLGAAGDFNGDGLDDLIIGAASRLDSAGRAYVVYGSRNFPERLLLDELDAETGMRVPGIQIGDELGLAVAGAGDTNGDGYDDLLLGAPGASYFSGQASGEVYLLFGSPTPPKLFDLRTLNGPSGRVIGSSRFPDQRLGESVAYAGDLNRDGYADVITGAPHYDRPNTGFNFSGRAYVVMGGENLPVQMDVERLDGQSGFTIDGVGEIGSQLSTADDVNGDGVDDVQLLSGRGYSSATIFGRTTGYPIVVNARELTGYNGFEISFYGSGDASLHALAGAGDLNQDGIGDLVVTMGSATGDDNWIQFGRQTPDIELRVVGSCPGEIQVGVLNTAPEAEVRILSSKSPGTTTALAPCADRIFELDDAQLLIATTTDGTGSAAFTVTVDEAHCGTALQAIDVTTCRLSELAGIIE